MKGVVVFSADDSVINSVSEAVLKHGIEAVKSTVDLVDLTNLLDRYPRYLLVLDSNQSRSDIFTVLEKTLTHNKIETRPIIYLLDEVEETTPTICYEFGISSIYSGKTDTPEFIEFIAETISSEKYDAAIMDLLVQIAQLKEERSWDEAITLLEDFIKKVPDHVRIVVELADLYMAKKDWTKASELLSELDLFQPPYVRGMHQLARCMMKQQKFDEAIDLYKKIELLSPDHVERIVQLGRALFIQGQVGEAKEKFDHARTLEPDHIEAGQGQGQCLLMEGLLNEALSLLRSFSSEREVASLFNNTAIIAVRNGHFDQGIELYNQALASLNIPDNDIQAKLYFNKGVGFKKWSKDDHAKECFSEAYALDETFMKAKDQLATIDHSEPSKKANQNDKYTNISAKEDQTDDIDDIFEPVLSNNDETSFDDPTTDDDDDDLTF